MPRIYFSSYQQASFSSAAPGASQTYSLMPTPVHTEMVRGNTKQAGVVLILVLTILVFVAFRWRPQKAK
jgi:hypothetical protein